MHNVYELAKGQLAEAVNFVKMHWEEMSVLFNMPLGEVSEPFWLEMQSNNRILVYRGGNGECLGLLTLKKVKNTVILDRLFVRPDARKQGIGTKLLGVAEKMARLWGVEELILEGRENQAELLPYFHRMGYILHCPLNEKGKIAFQKRLSYW